MLHSLHIIKTLQQGPMFHLTALLSCGPIVSRLDPVRPLSLSLQNPREADTMHETKVRITLVTSREPRKGEFEIGPA